MAHGVNTQEQATGVNPPVSTTAGLPVYFGTAPINSVDLTNVNKPKLLTSLADAVAAFGALSSDFRSWTLHEAIKAHFVVYNVGPIVCVNVLDPNNEEHVATATNEETPLVAGQATLGTYAGGIDDLLGIIMSTVVVKNTGESITYTLNSDYTLAFDANGYVTITSVPTGRISSSQILYISFSYLNPEGVTADDIIGGYSGGEYTGIEVVEQVFPALRLVPGFLAAPGYSQDPTVAGALQTWAALINGSFQAMALLDLPTDGTIATYDLAAAWALDNGYVSKYAQNYFLKMQNGTDLYHSSVVWACIHNLVDAANKLIPYVSASNQVVQGQASVLDDGTQVLLTKVQANLLNSQGINTFLNGFNGWKTWGNRTACYPGDTDVKDNFTPIRRMFNWIANTIQLTTDAEVDAPIIRRNIDFVSNTLGAWLNGLVAQEALVAGTIAFRTEDNPITDLENGIVTWFLSLTPPSPAEQLDFTLQYNPAGLAALFTS